MRAGRGLQSTTAIAAACLLFSSGVVGCTPPSPPFPDGATSPGVTVSAGTASPPPGSVPSLSGPAASPTFPTPAVGSSTASGQAARDTPAAPRTTSGSSTAPGPASGTASGTPTQGGATTGPAVEPSTEPPASPGPAARAAKDQLQPGSGPAVYYVAINDGGSRGVRFGCNDSLVAVQGAVSPGDALTVALGRLLGAGMPLDNDAALYDSLAASSLRFVSGYVNGSTAVVNLSGSLRPGGVCDIPRIEAQLTHTVVAASGATRAEIYVNGMPLEVALSLR